MVLKSFFCLALCSLVAHASPQPHDEKKFSFEDIYSDDFTTKSFSVEWKLNPEGKDVYTFKKDGAIMLVDPQNIESEDTIFTKEDLKDSEFYQVNSASDRILLGYNKKKNWRHSFSAEYKIMKKADKSSVEIKPDHLDYVGWSPTGDALSYVYKNELFVTNNLVDPSDGEINLHKNAKGDEYIGVPDWLYEEEILGSRVSHYWSPRGTKVCYSVINDAGIGKQHWLVYGGKDNVQEELKTIPYPKAGLDKAPTSVGKLSVSLIDFKAKTIKTLKLMPPTKISTEDHYFAKVKWVNDDMVYVEWVNRVQTSAYHVYYDLTGMTADQDVQPKDIYTEEENNGWVEVPSPSPFFLEDNVNKLIAIKAHKTKEVNWRNLVKFEKSGTDYKEEFLTKTEQEVDRIVKNVKDVVYFIKTGDNSRERKLFKLNLADQNKVVEIPSPENCRYLSVSFSLTGLYYLRSCLGPEVPSHSLLGMDANFKEKVYEDNSKTKDAFKNKDTVVKQYLKLTEAGESVIYMELYKPAVETGRKLPLLVYTYAGPGTQEVSDKYDWNGATKKWLLHVASTYDVAIASIDGRGTVGNGNELKFAMHKKMGVVEIADQIKGIEELAKREDIDEGNIAIFGWSYGGFTAANVLADSTSVKCALSVAPVTNKALYDTAYSERYLGLFKDNKESYGNTNIQNKADKFKGKKFLVAHGTADDNVHFTNFAHLVKELESKDILFTQLSYPDESHGISTPALNKHLFHSLTNFLKEDCFETEVQKSSAVILTTAPFKFILFAFSLVKYLF